MEREPLAHVLEQESVPLGRLGELTCGSHALERDEARVDEGLDDVHGESTPGAS